MEDLKWKGSPPLCGRYGPEELLTPSGHRRDRSVRMFLFPELRQGDEHLGTSVFGTRPEATRGHDWGRACHRRSSRQLKVDVTFPIQPHAKISIDHHQRSALLFVR
jgi:hypothetical protein